MPTLAEGSKRVNLSNKAVNDQSSKELELFKNIAISIGPSIYLKDASKISFTDVELKRIKDNFLIQKLELKDSKDLDNKFKLVTQEFVNSAFEKKRVFFYYYLVKFFNKEKIFRNDNQKETIKNTALNKIVDSFGKVKNQITKTNEEKLLDFGQKFIENQKDLDQDIFEIIDNNFSSLY
jgi:hypothetical protein